MTRTFRVPLVAATGVAIFTIGAVAAPPSYVQVVSDGPQGIELEVRIPPAAVRVQAAPDGSATVIVPGLVSRPEGPQPGLPVLALPLGVPEGAHVRLSWESGGEVLLPSVRLRGAGEALGREGDARSGPTPVLLEEMRFRALRMARVLVSPLRQDPGSDGLRLTTWFHIRVAFDGGVGFAAEGGALGALEERLVSRHLTNGATVAAGRRTASELRSPARESAAASFVPPNPGVKIRVDEEGLIRVTGADLDAIGFDRTTVDPRHLQVSFRTIPIPCRVVGEEDAVFDVGDAVEFYGWPNGGRFADANVFWLEEQEGPGLRYATVDATPSGAPLADSFPDTVHYEAGNSIYTFGKPVQEGDPHFFWIWFEDNPNPPRVTTFSHVASLTDVDTSGPVARLRAFFQGRTDPAADPDHRVRLLVNGTPIGESTWDGQTFHLAEVDFDPSLLTEGPNTVGIEYVTIAFPDIYYLDWFEVEYPRFPRALADRLTITGEGPGPNRYRVESVTSVSNLVVLDVTDPTMPALLGGVEVEGPGPYTVELELPAPAGKRILVAGDGGRVGPAELILDTPSDLRSTENGADEIIVVPEGWESGLAALVAERQAQGLRVVLASLTDVADEFAGGNVDDVAIRDFVAYAYANWQPPAVSFLLLVGEGNLDVKNDLGASPFYHFMPTHLGTTAALGETPTDTWFGAVSGSDLVPDVAVGRFSVRSADAAADVAAKIIDYESNPPVAPWGRNVVLVASNETLFENSLDAAAAGFLPSQFTVDRQYRLSGATGSTIRTALDSGALLASFFGHGNVDFWADSPGGPYFSNSDAGQLLNAGRLPFVTALNCLNGMFAHPFVTTSLAEELQGLSSGGALAIWSPSGLGFFTEYDLLHGLLFEAIFRDHVVGLGLATTGALVDAYVSHGEGDDLLKKMVFQGDPAGWLALDWDADGQPDRSDNCPEMANPSQEDLDGDGKGDVCDEDDDGDGVEDLSDCNPLDSGAWAAPGEVTALTADGAITLTWASQAASTGPGLMHDVLRGSLGDLRVDGAITAATCLVSGTGMTAALDPDPPLAVGSYYLVRARNSCGDGGYGLSTAGAVRMSTGCP